MHHMSNSISVNVISFWGSIYKSEKRKQNNELWPAAQPNDMNCSIAWKQCKNLTLLSSVFPTLNVYRSMQVGRMTYVVVSTMWFYEDWKCSKLCDSSYDDTSLYTISDTSNARPTLYISVASMI